LSTKKPKKTEAATKKQNTSVAIKINDYELFTSEICLKVCFYEEPRCPETWVSTSTALKGQKHAKDIRQYKKQFMVWMW
jgi:hypothetical protein